MHAAETRVVAVYEVRNLRCVPKDYTRALGGITPRFRSNYIVAGPMVTPGQYTREIVVYDDQLISENYFGRGICNWALANLCVEVAHGKYTSRGCVGRREVFPGPPSGTRFVCGVRRIGDFPPDGACEKADKYEQPRTIEPVAIVKIEQGP